MEKQTRFDKVLVTKDIIAIAFGAMIGWGWVINSGDWLANAGFIGTIIAFLIGGLMVLFVGLVYAELTAAMPKCGGEHVFSYRAFGTLGSFVCTWAIILGYVATAAFEAAAFPTVIKYLVGDMFDIGLMYHINGVPIYASYVVLGVALAFFITYINFKGVKTSASIQQILTLAIFMVGVVLLVASSMQGETTNLANNLFGLHAVSETKSVLGGILTVTCMTPFLFVGFDVIPQAAEEINIPARKIGKIMILSIFMAIVFYLAVVFSVAYVMPVDEITWSMKNGLVSADAMAKAFNWEMMGKVVVIGGMCGIITSWNSFLLGGSRALFAMGEAHMLPKAFGVIHKEYKTPVYAVLLCGIACVIAPFFGKPVLLWLVDAASFGCTVAYFMVSISFLVLRKKEPKMKRPYRIKLGNVVGTIAAIMSGAMMLLYVIPLPFASSALVWQEWIVVGVWICLGIVFYFYAKRKYGKRFGIQQAERM